MANVENRVWIEPHGTAVEAPAVRVEERAVDAGRAHTKRLTPRALYQTGEAHLRQTIEVTREWQAALSYCIQISKIYVGAAGEAVAVIVAGEAIVRAKLAEKGVCVRHIPLRATLTAAERIPIKASVARTAVGWGGTGKAAVWA